MFILFICQLYRKSKQWKVPKGAKPLTLCIIVWRREDAVMNGGSNSTSTKMKQVSVFEMSEILFKSEQTCTNNYIFPFAVWGPEHGFYAQNPSARGGNWYRARRDRLGRLLPPPPGMFPEYDKLVEEARKSVRIDDRAGCHYPVDWVFLEFYTIFGVFYQVLLLVLNEMRK